MMGDVMERLERGEWDAFRLAERDELSTGIDEVRPFRNLEIGHRIPDDDQPVIGIDDAAGDRRFTATAIVRALVVTRVWPRDGHGLTREVGDVTENMFGTDEAV